jgi:xanthine dehydrogenase accessory factor
MICSGKQTVIFRLLTPENAANVEATIKALDARTPAFLTITRTECRVSTANGSDRGSIIKGFEKLSDTEFTYTERLGTKNKLYVIGGGHCALALSELMSRMDFRISIFDDRPDLNTLDKNRFAHEKNVIQSYEQIGEAIPSGSDVYVVVMTLGYKSDEIVIRGLIDKDFKYLGVLGSKAKMKTLLRSLRKEGFPNERLAQIHTPIGLPIISRTPEEIAVSIAAEIIAIKNS